MDERTDTGPPLTTDDAVFGEWFYRRMVEEFAPESETWAIEQCQRVTERLNGVRLACPEPGYAPYSLHTHIVWGGQKNAFAAPGRYVYITRELLQCFPDDEPVALILAHEMAHQDLGHTRIARPLLEKIRFLPGKLILTAVVHLLEGAFRTAEREAAADAYGLDLCIAAGYAPERCLTAFDVLEAHLLDFRVIDGVFGDGIAHRDRHPALRTCRAHLRRQLAANYGVAATR